MKKYFTAVDMCIHTFSAIPLPPGKWDDSLRKLSTACLPVLGAIIGLLWWGIAALAGALLPSALRSAVIAAFPFLITGFIHLDGFMDTSDAILSWRDREEKLRILKDSHVGSFAVVMIALLFMVQFAACMSVEKIAMLWMIPVLSRCGSAFCVNAITPLGHSQYVDNEDSGNQLIFGILVMAVITVILGLIFHGWRSLIVSASVLLAYLLHMSVCVRLLGGVSGDLAGFCLTVSEACGLLALCLL